MNEKKKEKESHTYSCFDKIFIVMMMMALVGEDYINRYSNRKNQFTKLNYGM